MPEGKPDRDRTERGIRNGPQPGDVVKTYPTQDGKPKRVIENPKQQKSAPGNEPNGADRPAPGPEGDKNYWGGDVWKKRK